MTIFKSQQVNLDPEPYVVTKMYSEFRVSEPEDWGTVRYDPRPEFEPTRDPEPWLDETASATIGEEVRHSSESYGWMLIMRATLDGLRWAPRREQFDTPVNRVLVHYRLQRDRGRALNPLLLTQVFIATIGSLAEEGFTPAEITHARRVLTRLANLTETESAR